MKIVTASTPEQQDYVQTTVRYIYNNLLPSFFSSSYIKDLHNLDVLQIRNIEEYSLKEIMEITAALQTIQSILECLVNDGHPIDYKHKFKNNQRILEKHFIHFPFQCEDFHKVDQTEYPMSMIQPDNKWLI
ncbi:hypothetical protein GLW08_00155 [Pontibacillus yanchengensis]|uniref:Uncharacterized protein n=2 Tax=Pontibacillus yanchengensis TaxID=462910 RepID=A0ACC7VAF7_9BACI|nr:DUF5365 family protein [Pontibacillus yanchengensis]MYL32829.1 hypothetical protein [Pontibacillus yanchengensis]MYL51741.1 hypothetical protein [Pontibacillus yanchengensis]